MARGGGGTNERGEPRAPSVSGNNLMFAPRSFARVSQSYAEDRRLATGIDINVSLAYTDTSMQIDLYNIYAYIMIISTVASTTSVWRSLTSNNAFLTWSNSLRY